MKPLGSIVSDYVTTHLNTLEFVISLSLTKITQKSTPLHLHLIPPHSQLEQSAGTTKWPPPCWVDPNNCASLMQAPKHVHKTCHHYNVHFHTKSLCQRTPKSIKPFKHVELFHVRISHICVTVEPLNRLTVFLLNIKCICVIMCHHHFKQLL